MDVFRTDRIRNVVLLGHGGAGKTTLAEAMAYLAGMTNRLGRVEDGNTVSDYDKEEIKRHFSISTTLIPVPWDKVKIFRFRRRSRRSSKRSRCSDHCSFR